MTGDKQTPADVSTCPNCGAVVVYGGVGRRPVWCSTRCRNDASLKRLGARRAAVEVRVVEVSRPRPGGQPLAPLPATAPRNCQPDGGEGSVRKAESPTLEQALRVVRNDPAAVGKLLAHLERRRSDGTLSTPEWLPVRNALRLIAGALPPRIERPS